MPKPMSEAEPEPIKFVKKKCNCPDCPTGVHEYVERNRKKGEDV